VQHPKHADVGLRKSSALIIVGHSPWLEINIAALLMACTDYFPRKEINAEAPIKNLRVFSEFGVLQRKLMDDELREKLALWKVQPEIPPDFQRDVWQKIAAREARSSKSLLSGIWNISWLSILRPAALAIILGALAGTGLGLAESSQANARNWKTLEVKYVRAIDPYERLRTH
jgi:hypothetical protein